MNGGRSARGPTHFPHHSRLARRTATLALCPITLDSLLPITAARGRLPLLQALRELPVFS